MRLDHLLSKEHLAPLGVQAPDRDRMCLAGQLMGGTFDMPSAQLTFVSTHFGAGTWGLGSGAAARCWVLRDRVFGSSPSGLTLVFLPVGGLRGGYRPYFENYTVDASIL